MRIFKQIFYRFINLWLWWNGASDKSVSSEIDAEQNITRNNSSDVKIASNLNSADYPGIYFIWDSKQKDNDY